MKSNSMLVAAAAFCIMACEEVAQTQPLVELRSKIKANRLVFLLKTSGIQDVRKLAQTRDEKQSWQIVVPSDQLAFAESVREYFSVDEAGLTPGDLAEADSLLKPSNPLKDAQSSNWW
jgi:hypothetical protein